LVGDDLDRDDRRYADGPLEEAVGGLGVARRGHEHVDDLPGLVDRAVDVAPPAGDPVGARKSVVGSELRLR
jgi:hypothetical protein